MTTINIQELMADSGVEFGTSGARGLVSSMTDEVCAAYSLAFLQALNLATPHRKVALGTDLRPSSPAIVSACAEGVRQAGCDVEFCGALPTPALALYALSLGIPAIMITGSHIPFDRNGIKFYRDQGEISKTDESAIRNAVIELKDFPANRIPLTVSPQALQLYIRRYTGLFKPDLLSNLRIGVYEHSSVARDCLQKILRALGAEVIGLDRTETFVPIDTEAVSEEDCVRGKAWAAQYNLNAIISTDGDGDRPLIADETGNWLRGDIVGLLCAKFLGAKTVVTPVSCNTAIEVSGYFENVIRTRIGSPYVIAGMEQALSKTSGIAGFEANGGFLAGHGLKVGEYQIEPLPTRDAMLPALSILAMARLHQMKLSELLADLPSRYTASNRIRNFPTANSKILLDELQSNGHAYKSLWGDEQLGRITHQDVTDGLRLTFANSEIVHLRPSGNAPELRCYAEAASTERAEVLVNLTLRRIAGG